MSIPEKQLRVLIFIIFGYKNIINNDNIYIGVLRE